MILKSFYFWLKRNYNKFQFKKNAILGKDFNCLHTASISNPSGDLSRVTIADHCEICGNLAVDCFGRISIGEYTTIRYSSAIQSANNIIIGDHVIISNNVIIRDNNTHPTDPSARIDLCESGFDGDKWQWRHSRSSPVIIESNVWIGERSYICKGVTIGRGSIVAANSVVTKSVPQYCIVAGNPARVVKRLR